MVGIITLFKQFHPENYRTYILLLSHFFKNIIYMQSEIKPTPKQLPIEGYMTLAYLEELIKFEGESREVISQHIGIFVFDCYRKDNIN